MRVVILLLTFQIIRATDFSFDEDISLPVPQVILTHSPIDTPAPQFLTFMENCECREHPGKYITCSGRNCNKFPANLKITAPLFKLKLTSIITLQKGDLALYTNVCVLEIESNYKLERIEPGFFSNMIHVQNLTISMNEKLKYLDENVFEGLINLSTLSLLKNGFTKITYVTRSLAVKYLPHLFLLELNENIFREIGATSFHAMNGTRLEQLNMILCEIEYIHPDSLTPLKFLNTLRVGQNNFNSSVLAKLINRLTELEIPLDNLNLYGMGFRKKPPRDLMIAIGKSKIKFVHLTANHFDQLDDDSFPDMPNVKQLSLRGNHIVDITPNAFKRLPRLNTLLLTVNRLTQVPVGALLNTLTELDLAGNTYKLYYPSYFYISDEIFRNMTELLNLQLAYNNICLLTKSVFVGLAKLNRLNLKNASLTFIEPGAFLPLKNLISLNLINNPLSKYKNLEANVFEGLENLQILLLGGCHIRNILANPSLFTHIPNLKHLGLERNELFTLAPEQFLPLVSLESLDISENRLAAWQTRITGNNLNVRVLKAYQNKFTFITTAMLDDWATLDKLNIDENPLSCDCSLYTVVVWYRTHKNMMKYFSDENFIASCVSPTMWRHKSIVTYLLALDSNTSECENIGQLNDTIVMILVLICSVLVSLILLMVVCRYNVKYWIFVLNCKSVQRDPDNINYKWDVFVSYCTVDEWFVQELTTVLEPEFRLYIRDRDLDVGTVQLEASLAALAASRRSLLVVSEASMRSTWCQWEMQLIIRSAPLVILLQHIDQKHAPFLLNYLLRTRIYLRWPEEDGGHNRKVFWQKLRAALIFCERQSSYIII